MNNKPWAASDERKLLALAGKVRLAEIEKLEHTEPAIRQRAAYLGVSLYFRASCTIIGCNNKHLAKGYCRAHYLRLYKHGRLHVEKLTGLTVLERVLAKTFVDEGGCWIYVGCLTMNGYGHIRDGNRMVMTHAVTYTEKYGPVPTGLRLRHTCQRRACCNPDHLKPMTHARICRLGKNTGSTRHNRVRNSLGQFKGVIA